MPWGRIDDAFDDHAKVLTLLEHENGIAAIGLWTLCLAWAQRNTRKRDQVPGRIPAHLPRRYVGPKARELALLLVTPPPGFKFGLWEATDDGWMIHDFGDYLPTDELRAKKRAAGAIGAAVRWGKPIPAAPDGTVPSPDSSLPSGANSTDSTAISTRWQKPASGMVREGQGATAGSTSEIDGTVPGSGSTVPSECQEIMTDGMARDSSAMAIPSPNTQTQTKPVSRATSGTPVDPNIGDVVGAYVDGARATGQPDPAASLRARVGKQARLLLAEGVPVQTLIDAAHRMGQGEWNDLAVQVRKDAAAKNGHGAASPGQRTYTDEEYASGW